MKRLTAPRPARLITVAGLVVVLAALLPRHDVAASIARRVPVEPAATDLTYPPLYRSHSLPEHPDATLVSIGRQTTSLDDGLRLELTTKARVREAAKFYEEKMKALGWKVPPQRFPNDRVYLCEFTRDDLLYQLTITATPSQGSRIRILFGRR